MKDAVIARHELDIDVLKDSWEVPDFNGDIPFEENLLDVEHGTLVVWSNFDRLLFKNEPDFNKQLEKAVDHLRLVFHRFIDGNQVSKDGWPSKVVISVNNRPLEALDPFNLSSTKTQVSAPIQQHFNKKLVKVTCYVLPSKASYRGRLEEYEKYGLPGGYEENSGFFVYRCDRLIVRGDWFGLPHGSKELTKLSRIAVDLDNDQDVAWGLQVTKTKVKPPIEIKRWLEKQSEHWGHKSVLVSKTRAKRLTPTIEDQVWLREIGQDRSIFFKINREHTLISRLFDAARFENPSDAELTLKLLESSLPIHQIYVDMGSSSSEVSEPALAEDDVTPFVEAMFEIYTSLSMSGEEIKRKFVESLPLSGHAGLVESVLERLLSNDEGDS
jgi:hypothetical protein